MPAIREHDPVYNDVDDDDGMPPLVDNPNPSMTFTFFTDMTPITAFTADPTVAYESAWDNNPPISSPFDAPAFPLPTAPQRTNHAKKRDASYIPRPPNAFILFRSSFIRSQQVPEKVEGNHSTLSKIIGKYWKTLSREEREVWEAKALVAQAEHRRRYPDWRFRPGANALAKLKVKDGPGTTAAAATKRRTNRKGRGEAEAKKRNKDERCAMIADLLVEGKTGIDLQDAVKKWEDDAGSWKGAAGSMKGDVRNLGGVRNLKDDTGILKDGREIAYEVEGGKAESTMTICGPGNTAVDTSHAATNLQMRCKTPDAEFDTRFKVPLTAMFKRSLSAPAARGSPTLGAHSSPALDAHASPAIVAHASPTLSHVSPVLAHASPALGHSSPALSHGTLALGAHTRHNSFTSIVSEESSSPTTPPDACLSPLLLPGRWNHPYNPQLEPECPTLAYSPSMSPLDTTFGTYGFPSPGKEDLVVGYDEGLAGYNEGLGGYDKGLAGYDYEYAHAYSSYSALQGWAGDPYTFRAGDPYSPGGAHAFSGRGITGSPYAFGAKGAPAPAPAMYEWSPGTDTMRARDIASLRCVGDGEAVLGAGFGC
ncbi:hypothetical protein BV22DRAFT_1040290 [Leucogyrophana mollusca]|uniref:Uncharacterized protein n=1 Tax=Leucogyrophana mollusca TaxID=85980 RepID=A0ACB8B4Q3_9AGAM|nr:hypothetical protein BV22DRAFT_1040290 [Leucogyrophana mollusca]